MGKIILVTGGARSGKSSFAEKYAARHGQRIAYIATAQVYDEEMAYRVSLHKKRRPAQWQTYEAPYDAHEALIAAGQEHDLVLFDCLTLYISNLLCSQADSRDEAANYALLQKKISLLIAQAKKNQGTTIFVTNEVGAGIVPDNQLARAYRDLSGLANQMVGAAADMAYLVVCGMAVDVKRLAENLED